MLAGCSLDQPEHKVSLLEGSWLDLSVVVSAQALLVDGGPAECQQPALFQQIDAVLSCFFCFSSVYLVTRGESNSMSVGMTASAP